VAASLARISMIDDSPIAVLSRIPGVAVRTGPDELAQARPRPLKVTVPPPPIAHLLAIRG